MLPVKVMEKWIFTLFLFFLKIWLALWVTTDKKICAEEAACGVCILRKEKKMNKNVFEKPLLLAGCEDEVTTRGKQVTNGKDDEMFRNQKLPLSR